MTFARFVNLETHIRTCNANHQVFHCDKCEKGFVLKWRLKKHMVLHTENNLKILDASSSINKQRIVHLNQTVREDFAQYRHEVTINAKDDNNESDTNLLQIPVHS